MLKSKLVLFLSAIFFLVGCENQETINTQEEVEAIDTLETIVLDNDSIADVPVVSVNIFELPLKIDTTFISKSNLDLDSSNLSRDEVKALSKRLINARGDVEVSYVINDFIKIDSLKANDAYNDYLSTIDIAMTINANANSLGTISLNNDGFIDVWSISFTTIDACPFYSGTVIYSTFYNEFPGNGGNTILVGEISGGGDAPYWTDVLTTSKISNTTVDVNLTQNSGGDYDENDEEIIDVVNKNYSFTISENGFSPSK